MVEVYLTKILPESDLKETVPGLLHRLPRETRDELSKLKRNDVFQRAFTGELLVRTILQEKTGIPWSSFVFKKGEKGKPYLPGNTSFFNISHSFDYVAVAVSNDVEVGIDIEKIKPVNFAIAGRFFSQKEKEKLFSLEGDEKTEYFFDLWTLKESYLKLTGTGLTKPLNSFTVTGENGNFKLSGAGDTGKNVFFKQYQAVPGYKLSVCSYSATFSGKTIFWETKKMYFCTL